MAKFTYAAAAKQYAEQVVAGDIPACRWVKLACQRQLNDLAKLRSRVASTSAGSKFLNFPKDPNAAIAHYLDAIDFAVSIGLEINAGHDLNQENLRFFKQAVRQLDEVSIGHALISDALYLGIENTIQRYLYLLRD